MSFTNNEILFVFPIEAFISEQWIMVAFTMIDVLKIKTEYLAFSALLSVDTCCQRHVMVTCVSD